MSIFSSPSFNLLNLNLLRWIAFAIATGISAIAPTANAQTTRTATLSVEVTGLKNDQGQVCVSVVNNSEDFPNDTEAVVAKECVLAAEADTQSAITVLFTDLEPSTYAVSVFHDENEDNQLNTATFGIPTEGFGFSQNPTVRTRAPRFQETAIFVLGREVESEIEMIYF